MSTIFTCECGARLEFPADRANRAFCCPDCKAPLALSGAGQVLDPLRFGASGTATVCPICQSRVAEAEVVVTCPACRQLHHRECWAEVGGCGTYGCTEAPRVGKPPGPAVPLAAWGDTKKCPACGETIKAIAKKCRFCDTEFDTVDPLSLADLRRRVERGRASRIVQRSTVILFVLSFLGCLAPLVAVASIVVLSKYHKLLAKEGPLYLVMGYSAMGLSVLYSVLMLLFAVL